MFRSWFSSNQNNKSIAFSFQSYRVLKESTDKIIQVPTLTNENIESALKENGDNNLLSQFNNIKESFTNEFRSSLNSYDAVAFHTQTQNQLVITKTENINDNKVICINSSLKY